MRRNGSRARKVSGTPLPKNAGFPADSILDHFLHGHSILSWLNLDQKQIRIVDDYCAFLAAERHPVQVKR